MLAGKKKGRLSEAQLLEGGKKELSIAVSVYWKYIKGSKVRGRRTEKTVKHSRQKK